MPYYRNREGNKSSRKGKRLRGRKWGTSSYKLLETNRIILKNSNVGWGEGVRKRKRREKDNGRKRFQRPTPEKKKK